jgi:hypothetical protein
VHWPSVGQQPVGGDEARQPAARPEDGPRKTPGREARNSDRHRNAVGTVANLTGRRCISYAFELGRQDMRDLWRTLGT